MGVCQQRTHRFVIFVPKVSEVRIRYSMIAAAYKSGLNYSLSHITRQPVQYVGIDCSRDGILVEDAIVSSVGRGSLETKCAGPKIVFFT